MGLRAPLRTVQAQRDTQSMITLLCFLIVNMLPVHIFATVICFDYCWLADKMSPGARVQWLSFLYYATWAFVGLYAIKVMRLVLALIGNIQLWWVDWEGTLFNFAIERFFPAIKVASDYLWETYHNRTWSYIRGIQADDIEKREVIREISEERNLPDLVESLITDMVCLEGAQELDYRWYLHDNRHNMKALHGLRYAQRECIASFLIPEPAFEMNKDAIVDLFCFQN